MVDLNGLELSSCSVNTKSNGSKLVFFYLNTYIFFKPSLKRLPVTSDVTDGKTLSNLIPIQGPVSRTSR